jgi:hypothetical protein
MTNLTVNGELKSTDKIVIQDQSSRRMRAVLPQSIVDYVLSQYDPVIIPLQQIPSSNLDRTFDIGTFPQVPQYVVASQSEGSLTIDCLNKSYISTGYNIKFILNATGNCTIGFSGVFETEYGDSFELISGQKITIEFTSLNGKFIQQGELALI